MAGPKGYSSYRGKTPKGKIFLAVFLVLIILAAVAFIRLQKYIVYDDSGRPRLELPKSAEDPAASPAASSGGANGDVLPSLTIQEPERAELRAKALPVSPLTDWAAYFAALASQSANAVVYTVKDAEGSVYLDSRTALSPARKSAAETAAAVASMTGSGLYTVARLACFRDAAAASGDLENMGLKNTGGYVFYDGNNDRWLDPAKPAARQYLIALAKECAAQGFDEILLTDVSYPTAGKLEKIDYSGAGAAALRQANLVQFLTELRTALADTGVKLSLELPAELVLGGAPEAYAASGSSLAALAPLVDRVCAAAADENQAALLAQAVAAVSKTTAFLPAWGADPARPEYLDPTPLAPAP